MLLGSGFFSSPTSNYFIGASLSEPHINGTAMRAIYGICIYVYMYICIYVYMYIYMYGTSVIRAPLHRLCT